MVSLFIILLNQRWVLTKVIHEGKQPQALEEVATEGETTYNNHFYGIPTKNNWQAEPQIKPRIDGPLIGMVVGPDGQEIFCDEHGRVRVHFPWDRDSQKNEKSSCWIRVSQAWAGGGYGAMAIPRIGHEVIVSFLDGDPDQPIITGRTYHSENVPAYPLPANKTKTVLRSDTHQGDGYNELSFEDQVGNEQVYVHAQKDYKIDVLNDRHIQIGNDTNLMVSGQQVEHILKDQQITVEQQIKTLAHQDISLVTNQSLHMKQGERMAVDATTEVHVKAGTKVVLEAGVEGMIKAGSNFIKVDHSGIYLNGPVFMKAGSPTQGAGYSGLLPQGLTVEPVAQALVPLTTAQVATLSQKAPFCEECEACKDGQCPI